MLPVWASYIKGHKQKSERVRYGFPGPSWRSRPSYSSRLHSLDISNTISRFDHHPTMCGVVGCLWGKYDNSWDDDTRVNTSYSRQAVNLDVRRPSVCKYSLFVCLSVRVFVCSVVCLFVCWGVCFFVCTGFFFPFPRIWPP